MNLVIVESPTKAKKLSQYLSKDYQIEASVGHVRDLPKKTLGVDEETLEPVYEPSADKKSVIAKLRKLAMNSGKIYLAMDPDREGEAIAWHVKYLLEHGKAKKAHEFLRSTFHEITKVAVLKAIENPSKINMALVDAQQARRVLDRLVGYKVSPVLWRKVRRGLSAGRVQSPALRLIVEREREIEAFKAQEYWELDVLLKLNEAAQYKKTETDSKPDWLDETAEGFLSSRVFKVAGKKFEPEEEAQVTPLIKWLKKADYKVIEVEKKQRQRRSYAPFTTSTLQQAAANKLGMTSKQTMRLAQQLYEEGLITYHRTDSINLSVQAINMAREYIASEFGQNYLPEKPRIFKGKSKNAQEAHEAIRVTHVKVKQATGGKITARHQKLYDLIWRRFVASQMQAAVYDQTTIQIEAKGKSKSELAMLRTTGSTLKFDGWMRLFTSSSDVILPELSKGQDLYYADLFAAQKFTQAPPRYNDASLVKELEKRGIGRPSTYASIISVIVDRGYVEREDKRFKPTSIGCTVSDFLLKYFNEIMDYDFTAQMEDDLDEISRGKKEWQKIVKSFYTPFKKKIDTVSKEAKRAEIPVEKTGESCPECGKEEKGEIVIRTGRFGKFKSCSRFPDCKFTENIVEKVEGQHCPLCQKGEIIIKKTRWGKDFYGCSLYPKCDWASWAKPEPGLKLTPAAWKKIQTERKAKAAKRKKAFKNKRKKG